MSDQSTPFAPRLGRHGILKKKGKGSSSEVGTTLTTICEHLVAGLLGLVVIGCSTNSCSQNPSPNSSVNSGTPLVNRSAPAQSVDAAQLSDATPDDATDGDVTERSTLEDLDESFPCSSIQQTRFIGGAKTAAAALAVHARGFQASVAIGEAGVQIFDVRDHTVPTQLGLVDTPGKAQGLDVFERYLFVADGPAGLQIIDIEDPSAPTITGSLETPGQAVEVRVSKGVAFVADREGGLQIIDVSDPTSPTPMSTVATDDDVRSVRIREGYAYLAVDHSDGRDGSLSIIDVQRPDAPVVVTTLTDVVTAPGGVALDIHKHRAYLSTRDHAISVFDVRDPASPRRVGNLCHGSCENVTTDVVFTMGDRAYFTKGDRLVVADVSTPGQEQNVAVLDAGSTIKGISVHGKRIYLAASGAGLKIARLELPFPGIAGVAELEGTGEARVVGVKGRHAVVGHEDTLDIVDISSAWSMSSVGTVRLGGTVLSMVIVGNRAIVGTSNNDAVFVNISEARAPVEEHRVSLPSDANGLFAKGQQLFVAYGARRGGLAIIELGESSPPEVLSTLPLPSGAREVSVYEDRAYVTFGPEGGEITNLEVVDVSDPSTPRSLGSVDLTGTARGLALSGQLILVGISGTADSDEGPRLVIFDGENATEPSIIGVVELEHPLRSIQAIGRFAFCASQGEGLVVVDLRDPHAASIAAVVNHLGNRENTLLDASWIAVSGRFAYLVAGEELIAIELCGPPWRRDRLLTQLTLPLTSPSSSFRDVKRRHDTGDPSVTEKRQSVSVRQ